MNCDTDFKKQGDLVCEALVREIGRANRWKAVQEGWDALLHVRAMQEQMMNEFQDEGELKPDVSSGKTVA